MKSTFVLGLLVAVCSANAQVYKCPDKSGRVIYSDQPCEGKVIDPSPNSVSRERAPERARERYEQREEMRLQRDRYGTDRDRITLERERIDLERDRLQLDRDKVRTARETELPSGAGNYTPSQTGVNSHACAVAKRNLGVGINQESKERSQREYEIACFGDRAADIEEKRQGRTNIRINVHPRAR